MPLYRIKFCVWRLSKNKLIEKCQTVDKILCSFPNLVVVKSVSKKSQPVLNSGSFSCMFLRWCIFHFKGHSRTRAFKNAFCVLYYPPYNLPKFNRLFWNVKLYSVFCKNTDTRKMICTVKKMNTIIQYIMCNYERISDKSRIQFSIILFINKFYK